jgi:hypothetical protein
MEDQKSLLEQMSELLLAQLGGREVFIKEIVDLSVHKMTRGIDTRAMALEALRERVMPGIRGEIRKEVGLLVTPDLIKQAFETCDLSRLVNDAVQGAVAYEVRNMQVTKRIDDALRSILRAAIQTIGDLLVNMIEEDGPEEDNS